MPCNSSSLAIMSGFQDMLFHLIRILPIFLPQETLTPWNRHFICTNVARFKGFIPVCADMIRQTYTASDTDHGTHQLKHESHNQVLDKGILNNPDYTVSALIPDTLVLSQSPGTESSVISWLQRSYGHKHKSHPPSSWTLDAFQLHLPIQTQAATCMNTQTLWLCKSQSALLKEHRDAQPPTTWNQGPFDSSHQLDAIKGWSQNSLGGYLMSYLPSAWR